MLQKQCELFTCNPNVRWVPVPLKMVQTPIPNFSSKCSVPCPRFMGIPRGLSLPLLFLTLLLPLMSLTDRLSCPVAHAAPIPHHINPDTEPRPSASTGHLLIRALHSHRELVYMTQFTKDLGQWQCFYRNKKIIRLNTTRSTSLKILRSLLYCPTRCSPPPHPVCSVFPSPSCLLQSSSPWGFFLCVQRPATHALGVHLPPK